MLHYRCSRPACLEFCYTSFRPSSNNVSVNVLRSTAPVNLGWVILHGGSFPFIIEIQLASRTALSAVAFRAFQKFGGSPFAPTKDLGERGETLYGPPLIIYRSQYERSR